VNAVHRSAVVGVLILSAIFPASAKKKAPPKRTPSKAQIEAATCLQVFLDRANFSPGRIDGRYNDCTWKALGLYRESHGEQPQAPPSQPKAQRNLAPEVNGLDLASVEPVYIPYTVTEADLQGVRRVPGDVAAKAKLKFLPYRDSADAIAEKFHCDIHFLEQLNPGKLKAIKAGDQLNVPNVEPFELASVKDIQLGSETASEAANQMEYQPETHASTPGENVGPPRNVAVKIDTKTNTLGVFEAEKLIAAYPVTLGSTHTASPIGEWKVRRTTKMPTFRYDREFCNTANAAAISTCSDPDRGILWA